MCEDITYAALVPELLVTNLAASLGFWQDLCGFKILYGRPEEKFAYLDLCGAQVMLEERGIGRNWISGPLEPPYGRGINFQIELPEIAPIIARLAEAKWPLFMPYEEKWYSTGTTKNGQGQFIVQDPDGYLLRFAHHLGQTPA